ncbi:cytochrome P450 71A9 [Artemisia annua]|uniref:Cytochrome P450 71A9 n=1 Tax=Artemisia annua TaxID=35608 RepID=A0A2U1QGR3_ARTAN|nr:cytochrome P450 71A9 [Artemisia annua]
MAKLWGVFMGKFTKSFPCELVCFIEETNSKLQFGTESLFHPPGPRGLPIIGNLHQIDHLNLHTSLWNISKTYGPIVSLQFGFIPTIVVSSASLAKEVLKTQDSVFCSRALLHGQWKLSYNGLDVVFSPYHEYRREMRKIFMAHLLGPKRRYQDGHESKEVFRQLTELQAMMANFFASDLWPGLPFVGWIDKLSGKSDRLEKCFQYFDLFYQNLIDEHAHPIKFSKCEESEEDFLDILLRLKKDQHLNLTYNHVKANLMVRNNLLLGIVTLKRGYKSPGTSSQALIPIVVIRAIHPPCIYAGAVASAMGFGLCRSKMMNGIVALHLPPMRKDDAEKNGRLFRFPGCAGSCRTSKLFTLKFKHVGAKDYPALLLRSNRSLLTLLRRRFAFSSL